MKWDCRCTCETACQPCWELGVRDYVVQVEYETIDGRKKRAESEPLPEEFARLKAGYWRAGGNQAWVIAR